MTEQSSITRAESARLQSLIERTTLEPWEFRNGHNREGDSCDLLMAEVGRASEDEEPEYAEVFFGQAELGEAQVQANWDFAKESRTALPAALRQLKKAMELSSQLQNRIQHGGDCPRSRRVPFSQKELDKWICSCGVDAMTALLGEYFREGK
jgi:hypothetical protein